jgi:hypothetical protein
MNTVSVSTAGDVRSVQVVEDESGGITLFGFDGDEACIVSLQGLEQDPVASLLATVNAALTQGLPGWNTHAAQSAALYDLLTSREEGWEVVAEHDGDVYFAYEEDMSNAALRVAGAGYVLGLLHLKPEGNWFEVAGVGSIWRHTFRSPVEAEAALDELGQDCEIHAVASLLEKGCVLA